MAKFLSTLLLAAAIPGCIHAQSTHAPRFAGGKHKNNAATVPAKATNAAGRYAAKTTATSSRLISAVSLEYDGTGFTPIDSAAVTYSGTRGGTYNNKWAEWDWGFDNALAYTYSPATSAYGAADYKTNQLFDAGNRVTSQTGEEWAAHLSIFRNSYNSSYTYDGAGNKLSETSQSWDTIATAWKNTDRDTYTYTAANKIATFLSESWNNTGGVWHPNSRNIYTYDAGNKLITDSSEYWNSSLSAWVTGLRISYTYDAANNLILEAYDFWNATTMAYENSARRTYTYDASNRRTEQLFETYDATLLVWEPSTKILYSDFAGTQAQTMIYQSWDGGSMTFDNNMKEHYTYNGDGFVTYLYNEEWNAVSSAWELNTNSSAERNRYETYSTTTPPPTTGITNNQGGTNLLLYPMPATNTITVAATWAEAEPFTVTITDIAGRCYSRMSHPGQKNYKEDISVINLQPGNYLVTLQSKNGNSVRPLTIVK